MVRVAIFVIILVAIFYILTFLKIKRDRSKRYDTIGDYHKTVERIHNYRDHKSQITNQVTKYNSSSDYREAGNASSTKELL